jgi:hypothetical protein
MKTSLAVVIIVAWVVVLGTTAFGQTAQGDIIGTVSDAQGAVVAGAIVKIINESTGSVRDLVADERGDYVGSGLFIGTYRVEAEKPGFEKSIVSGVAVSSATVRRVDLVVKVAATQSTVTVAEEPSVVKTEGAAINSDMPSVLFDKPISPNYRGAWAFDAAQWVPGSSGGYQGFFLWGGLGGSQNELQVEGGQQSLVVFMNSNTIQEISIVQGAPPPEYARAVTAEAIIKSGTNDLHGGIVVNYYNPAVAAVDSPFYQGPRAAGFPQWFYDLQAGGPVYIPKVYNGRNKTFWFYDWQHPRAVGYDLNQTVSLPSQPMFAGNYSQYPVKPKDPLTGLPFPGGSIPASRISPVAQAVIKDWTNGLQYTGSPNSYVQNVNYADPIGSNPTYNSTLKLDQNVGTKNTLTYSMVLHHDSSFQGQLIPSPGNPYTFPLFSGAETHRNKWAIGDVHVFTPRLLNELRLNVYRDTSYSNNQVSATDTAPVLGQAVLERWGIQGVPVSTLGGWPQININNWLSLLPSLTGRNDDTRYSAADSLTYNYGRHTIKGGFSVLKSLVDKDYNPGFGTFNFDGRFTGEPLADFLLGLPGTFSRSLPRAAIAERIWELAAYIQDEFRVTSRLTLTYGLRWDHFTAPYDKNDEYFNFDPQTGQIVVPNQKALDNVSSAWPSSVIPVVLASTVHYPSKLTNPTGRFLPRFGFAYRPTGSGSFVIRGGYGIYSGMLRFAGLQTGGPFAVTQSFSNSLISNGSGGGTPQYSWPNPFPTGAGVSGASTGVSVNPNYRSEYTQTYNISVERQLISGLGLRLSYLGNKSTQMATQYDLNTPLVSSEPFSQSRRPYPSFQDITEITNGGNDRYNAFQAVLHHPLRAGMYAEIGYTVQKSVNDLGGPGNGFSREATPIATIDYAYDRSRDTGISTLWPRQDFLINYAWELPFGKGKRFLSDTNGRGEWLLARIFGGWSTTGIFNWHSGNYVTPYYTGSDPGNINQFTGRPNVVPGCKLYPGGPLGANNPLFNASCFTIPANGTLGNAQIGSIETPGSWMFSLNPWKEFHFPKWERGTLRLGANIYNLLNHPNYGPPSGNITDPNGALPSNYPFIRRGTEGAGTAAQGQRAFFFSARLLF